MKWAALTKEVYAIYMAIKKITFLISGYWGQAKKWQFTPEDISAEDDVECHSI